jgi:FkbH-like protein
MTTQNTQCASARAPASVDPVLFAEHNGPRYRTPIDLQVTPDPELRFLVIGACLAEALPLIGPMINPGFKGDFILMNQFDQAVDLSSAAAAQYDFQIVHLPLRSILGSAYFQLPDDGTRHEEFLEQTQDQLARYLTNALKLNGERKLATYVLGLFVPQQNPLGRFPPRYDLRNIMHFIERLNMFVAAEIAKRDNVFFVDIDQISSSIGKKFCQDDMVWSFTHGTTLSNGDQDHDANRIEPPAPMQQYYSERWLEFFQALFHEIIAMHRTLKQQDAVKLVAIDLDDTLWRGVAAEGSLGVLEGWPIGWIEALLYLKKRGILLATISKNDERFVRDNWNNIVQGLISLDDFSVHKINFRSKAENLAEILDEVNLRPHNVVMVDDNPIERAAIVARLPGVRVLGRELYYLKRILLWAPESQRRAITQESVRKTQMMHAQLQRETARKSLSQEDFLRTLCLRLTISVVRGTSDLHMTRTLELFNKTNQFNTTGERYTLEQCHQYLLEGRRLYVATVQDRFTQYGLVVAAWVRQNCIDHLVMSCRVFGLGVEDALLATIAHQLRSDGATLMFGRLQPTDANALSRQLYPRHGFTEVDGNPGLWVRPLAEALTFPDHVFLTVPEAGLTPETEMKPGSLQAMR